ncbi:MAG TPA: dTMP kinase [bacterium]|nr:dTMP kinase [bacterium]
MRSPLPSRGIFITLEGPEGAGKTTQGRLLADYLRGGGREVVCVREPGGTAIGERIRTLLLDPAHCDMTPCTEMLLFAASRAQLVREVVVPALRAGRWVVCDRFVDASLAYQGVGRGLDVEVVRSVNAAATDGLAPDLTVLLDIDPATGLARARAKTDVSARTRGAGDRMEQEVLAFHQRVREGFLSLAQKEPQRIAVIDARGPVGAVQDQIRRVVVEMLGRRGEGPGREGSR